MEYIYILKLEKGKYYVGKTNNISRRIKDHKHHKGASWTKKYKPIELVDTPRPMKSVFDEYTTTICYMYDFGINNVRGAQYCAVNLRQDEIRSIKQMFDNIKDTCFICHKKGHFAKNCPNSKRKKRFELEINKFNNNYKLRSYQINGIYKLYNHKSDRGKIIMPCGTGKTTVFITFLKIYKFNTAIILAPSKKLVDQIYERLCREFPKKFIKHYKKRSNDSKNKIIVSTYQSVKKFKYRKFDIGIFDEAHKCKDGTKDMGFALRDENIKIKKRIYFTATEFISKEDNDMRCKELYGDIIFKYNMKDAIDEGYICNLFFKTYSICNEDVKNQLKLTNYIYDENLIKKYDKNIIMSCGMIIREIKRGICKKVLTFHNTINNVKLFYNAFKYVLSYHNINIAALKLTTGKIDAEINDFKSNKYAVLSSCKKLNEGIDIPCVDGIVFVDNTESEINIIQRIGRGTRLCAGKKYCNIYIPVGNKLKIIRAILKALEKYAPKLLAIVYKNLSPSEHHREIIESKIKNKKSENKLTTNDVIKEIKIELIMKIISSCDNITSIKLWYDINKKVPTAADTEIYKKWCNFKTNDADTIYKKINQMRGCEKLIRALEEKKDKIIRAINKFISNRVKFKFKIKDKLIFRIIEPTPKLIKYLNKLGLCDNIVIKNCIDDENIMQFYKVYIDNGIYRIKHRGEVRGIFRLNNLIFITANDTYNVYKVPQNCSSPFKNNIVKIKTPRGANFNYRNYTYKCGENGFLKISKPIIDLSRENIKERHMLQCGMQIKFINKPDRKIFNKCGFKNIKQVNDYYIIKNMRTKYTAGNERFEFLLNGEVLHFKKQKRAAQYNCKKLLHRIRNVKKNIRVVNDKTAYKAPDNTYFTVTLTNLIVNDYKINKINKINNCTQIFIKRDSECYCSDIYKHCHALVRVKKIIEEKVYGNSNNVIMCEPVCESCGAEFKHNEISFTISLPQSNNFAVTTFKGTAAYYKVFKVNNMKNKFKSKEFI